MLPCRRAREHARQMKPGLHGRAVPWNRSCNITVWMRFRRRVQERLVGAEPLSASVSSVLVQPAIYNATGCNSYMIDNTGITDNG